MWWMPSSRDIVRESSRQVDQSGRRRPHKEKDGSLVWNPTSRQNKQKERAMNKLASVTTERTLSTVDALLRVAEGQGPVFDLARQMIGIEELALLISKAALKHTSLKLSRVKVARALKMSDSGARNRIENAMVKEDVCRA
jgi:hypothetical protein